MKKELTDERLVFLICKGDSHAEAIFYDKYYQKSKIAGRVFYLKYGDLGISEDEFTAVAYSSVALAINKYKQIKGSFNSYWSAIVKNEVAKYIEENTTVLSNKSNISLDDECYENNDVIQYHDTLSSSENDDGLTLKECIKKYIYSPTSDLSDEEALVAHLLFYREYSLEEIMNRTGWKRAKTYYVMRNTRKKISDYLKSAYFN